MPALVTVGFWADGGDMSRSWCGQPCAHPRRSLRSQAGPFHRATVKPVHSCAEGTRENTNVFYLALVLSPNQGLLREKDTTGRHCASQVHAWQSLPSEAAGSLFPAQLPPSCAQVSEGSG